MTHRLTTNYAKNYCNQTLIVKVIVENVVTMFFWDTVYKKTIQDVVQDEPKIKLQTLFISSSNIGFYRFIFN